MDSSTQQPLSLEQVRHVAKLARLRLSDEQVEKYRRQLSTILDHIEKLKELDVTGIEPLAHPTDSTNRLAEDEVGPSMPVEDLLRNAPAVHDRYLSVPKVLGDESSS